MSTIKFGTNTTAFPLASMPTFDGNLETIVIQKSNTVTSDVVLAALKGADGFTIDSGTAQTGYRAPNSVTVGTNTITVFMAKLSNDQLTMDALQKNFAFVKSAFAAIQAAQ